MEKTNNAGRTPFLSVAVVGRKGGAGKTTTVFNLAGALAHEGRRVLLVDLDPQASLTGILRDERGGPGIGEALLTPRQGVESLIVPCGGTLFPEMFLIPGNRTIERAAQELSDTPAGFYRLKKLLAPLHTAYDVIIIDTPPALGFAISSALLAADLAVLPTRTAQHDLDALGDTVDLIQEQEDLGGARLAAVVPSAIRPRELHDRGAVDALTASFGDLLTAPIPYSPRVLESLTAREPLVSYDPHSAGADAYAALAARVLQEGSTRG